MALTLPIYKRNNTFVLHLRVRGRQIKRSLGTLDPNLAKLRAMQLLGEVITNSGALAPASAHGWRRGSSLFPSDTAFEEFMPDEEQAASYALRNRFEQIATNAQHLPHALTVLSPVKAQSLMRKSHELPTFFAHRTALENADQFKLAQVFANYIAVRKIKEVTKFDYQVYAKEITPYLKNKDIRRLTEADVNALISHLRITLGNDARTVDNKVGFLRAVINHLIKQGMFVGSNPASAKNLVSKRERRKGGTKPIAYNDLQPIFGDGRFATMRSKKPEIYLIVMTGLVTGMRVSSVARLKTQDLKISMEGIPYIDISSDKTVAGNRDIPVPATLHESLKKFLSQNDGFGLTKRDVGKGYSDAVNKPIKAFLKEFGLDGLHERLSFHAFRKSFNDYLLKQGVEQYICGAVLGHVDESMTTGVYARAPSVEFIASKIGGHQSNILKYLNFQPL